MNESKKVLVENIFSLSFIQILNYLIPFITFPYLISVLGVEKFGLINFATAFVSYFILIIEYGFNISAVQLISINRNDKSKISEIVTSIFIIKMFLFIISSVIFLFIIYFFNQFKVENKLYLITYLSLIGNLFMPIWFFQGIEKSKYVAVTNFIIKLIWAISIFYLIKNDSDYMLLTFLNSSNSIIWGIILFITMITGFKVKIIFPSKSLLKKLFIDSGVIFLSTCSISLYTISNTFFLGILTNNEVVGYYTAADKIKTAVQNMITPFTQSMYPRVSYLFSKSKTEGKDFIFKSFKYIGSLTLFLSLLLFLFSETLINTLIGNGYYRSVTVLKIISFIPFIVYLSNLFGIQTMLNLSYKKEFTILITIASTLNLIFTFLFVPKYFEIGSAISVLLTEIFVTSSFIIFLKSKGFFKNEI